jgi:hypothetical protein
VIHRFPRLWSLFFDRSNQEQGEWAEALRENGVGCEYAIGVDPGLGMVTWERR